MEFSTVGGNVATNAGGMCCVKYGVTGDFVIGLEAVLADGRVLRTGRRTVKGVAGYDLTHLLVGSEGTLGAVLTDTYPLCAPRNSTEQPASPPGTVRRHHRTLRNRIQRGACRQGAPVTDHSRRNDTAKDAESDHDSAAGPEPTGAETPGALGAPTPSRRTEQASDSDDEPGAQA